MGPILYGFICDLASNLGEVLHADEYVLGLDKQRTSEMHLRSFSRTLYMYSSAISITLLLFFSLHLSLTTHIHKTFNDHNNPSVLGRSVYKPWKKWSLTFSI